MDYLNKKVEVYRNLHTGGMSVRENAKPRHVIDSDCRELIVENAEFVVQEATRLKVVREKQKQVHAFIKGIATNNNELINNKTKIEVTYNPYLYKKFIRKDTKEELLNKDYLVGIEVFNINENNNKKTISKVCIYID